MPRVIVLFIAVSEALAARTDLLCYFAMIVNTLMSASILSIVYPLSVFFWGMLSVPRPTKFYWVATITYTEVCLIFAKGFFDVTIETFQSLTLCSCCSSSLSSSISSSSTSSPGTKESLASSHGRR